MELGNNNATNNNNLAENSKDEREITR